MRRLWFLVLMLMVVLSLYFFAGKSFAEENKPPEHIFPLPLIMGEFVNTFDIRELLQEQFQCIEYVYELPIGAQKYHQHWCIYGSDNNKKVVAVYINKDTKLVELAMIAFPSDGLYFVDYVNFLLENYGIRTEIMRDDEAGEVGYFVTDTLGMLVGVKDNMVLFIHLDQK